MILVNNISFSYSKDDPPLFEDLSLTIEDFSWIAIMGQDGVGKSTLGKLIKGLVQPDSGSVVFNEAGPGGSACLGYLGGDPYDSFVGISVEEDIVFEMENQGIASDEMEIRLNRALAWTGLAGMKNRLVHTLSGGEQQKVGLAGVLAAGAKVLIVDEALSMLDRPSRLSIRSLLGTLRRTPGLTIIEITHSLEEAMSADRILFLARGGVQFDGSPADFMSSQAGNRWAAMAGGLPALRHALLECGIIPAHQANDGKLLDSLLNYLNK
ncbi:MAG: ATP-binding cassette domain-containing protein [Desulfomonile tiedjei]|nr:ATP-binding cassette domain-containing protein [Desulfomonile tiedjei]